MSWYSDNERYNERPDPEYCRRCRKTEVTKEICDRCVQRHENAESAELSNRICKDGIIPHDDYVETGNDHLKASRYEPQTEREDK